MSIPRSRELVAIQTQARDIARKTGRTPSTAQLLLALFTVPNRAAIFLTDRNITVDALLDALRTLPDEDPEILERVESRSLRIARGSGAESVNSLHLLAALVREACSHAYRLLDETGVEVAVVRTAVMSYATGSRSLPRRFLDNDVVHATAPAVARQIPFREHAPSPIGFHPGLRIETGISRSETTTIERERERPPSRSNGAASSGAPPPASRSSEHRHAEPEQPNGVRRAPEVAEPVTQPMLTEADAAAEAEEDRRDDALDEARETARKLAQSLFKRRQEVLEERRRRETAEFEAQNRAEIEAQRHPIHETTESVDLARSAERDRPARSGDEGLADAYRLDPDQYPNLHKFGRNLTVEAALGRIDDVVGRDREVTQLIDIIGKRRSNNPLLVGEAGVGKTAIVEGLARKFVELARADNRVGKRAIVELEIGRLVGGTHLRGAFAERIVALKDEVARAGGDVIVFLDEIHTWMNAGGGGDGADASGELKTALARGEFPCIGATTSDEFRRFVEADPAFERRFDVVFVEEPEPDTATAIVRGIRSHYEDHHGICYEEDALTAAVRLSQRFIHERRLPDKAIGVLDLAGSRAARVGATHVGVADIAAIVAELASLPPERLTQSDRERFLHMEAHMREGLVGHEHVVHAVCEVIRRNYAGFRSQRPIGSMLFLGPTGVGKTELVKVLADFLFYDRDAIVRFDMSEFMESHSVSRLIGAPPGYVGFEAGGQLTEAVRRRPYQIVLLDEIEKAHPDVLNVLLQLLDEGRLTDGRGRHVDFCNTVVIMTSNLGASVFSENRAAGRIGFGGGGGNDPGAGEQQLTAAVLNAAKDHFPPELWNRIDERLVFSALSRSEVVRIAALQLASTARRLREESDIELRFSDGVVQHLVRRGGYDPELGARPMRQTIERLIEGSVAKLILCGDATHGDTIFIDVDDDDALMVYAET